MKKRDNPPIIKPVVRAPHIPNKVHKDKSKYTRKKKHKEKEE